MKAATEQPAPSAPAARSPINFGALQAPKKQTGSSYPVLPDELGTAGKLATEIRQTREALEALEGKEKTLCAELSSLVTDNFYWQYYAGKGAVESSVEVACQLTRLNPKARSWSCWAAASSFPSRRGRVRT